MQKLDPADYHICIYKKIRFAPFFWDTGGKRKLKIVSELRKKITEKIRPKVVYKGTKLSSFFSTKDKVKDMHCTKLVYYYKGSGGEERDDYVGETKCRMGKRTQQHQRSDKESAIYQNYTKRNIDPPDPKDFSILAKNYNNRTKELQSPYSSKKYARS